MPREPVVFDFAARRTPPAIVRLPEGDFTLDANLYTDTLGGLLEVEQAIGAASTNEETGKALEAGRREIDALLREDPANAELFRRLDGEARERAKADGIAGGLDEEEAERRALTARHLFRLTVDDVADLIEAITGESATAAVAGPVRAIAQATSELEQAAKAAREEAGEAEPPAEQDENDPLGSRKRSPGRSSAQGKSSTSEPGGGETSPGGSRRRTSFDTPKRSGRKRAASSRA